MYAIFLVISKVVMSCRCMGHLYNPHMKIRENEKFMFCSKKSSHVTFGPREDRVQVSHVLDSDSDCTDIPNSKSQNFFIQTSNWVFLFLLESRFRALSNPFGITFKFIRSVEISTKQPDATSESESNYKPKGVASPPLGPMILVRPRVSFRLPWDVLPPPWPPSLAFI